MEEKRTGLFENGLIWFGAGVSIAEILTGTYLAPLGMGTVSYTHLLPEASENGWGLIVVDSPLNETEPLKHLFCR